MPIEAESRSYQPVHKVGYANRVIKKRRQSRKIIRKTETRRVLQKLYDACKQAFKGPGTVHLPQDVDRLCHLIDKMKPEDVGLSSQMQFFNPNKPVANETPAVATTTIHKCDKFSLCLFFLPANGVIPLHNHPGMTVFSKLLLGTMHIKSYDLVTPPSGIESPHSNVKLARLVEDSVFEAPCDTSVLYPTTGGNIHEFTAITPCAVLDVIGPPYSLEDGRDGTFYKDYPFDAFSSGVEMKEGERFGWLEEIEMPENSEMDTIQYLGPQIVQNNSC